MADALAQMIDVGHMRTGQKIRIAAVREKLHLFSGDGRKRIEV